MEVEGGIELEQAGRLRQRVEQVEEEPLGRASGGIIRGFRIRDSRFEIPGSRFGIRDSGFGIRDSGFGIQERPSA
jgi:hypothetical protein